MCLLKPEPGRLAIIWKQLDLISPLKAVRSIWLPLFLLWLLPVSVVAEPLFLEDPLNSFPVLTPDSRRMELGSTYLSAEYWMGMRNTFRYQGRRGEVIGWSVTLPWIYSSYHERGGSGRGNLRAGATLRLAGGESNQLRLAGDTWLPFSSDLLFPLQVRRGLVRFTLLGDLQWGGLTLRSGVGYRREISSLGPEREDIWPERFTIDGEAGLTLTETWSLLLGGGLSTSPDDITWGEMAAGFELRPYDLWRVKLTAGFMRGTHHSISHYDYKISLSLGRDLIGFTQPEDKPEAPEGSSGMGGDPP